MAKRKSSESSVTPATSTTKRIPSASQKSRQPTAANKSSTEVSPTFSNEQIGHAAGDLWRLLDKEGPQTLATIKKGVDASNDITLAAIGWLAREGKIDFSGSARTVKISLR
jgi:hypothetical protein